MQRPGYAIWLSALRATCGDPCPKTSAATKLHYSRKGCGGKKICEHTETAKVCTCVLKREGGRGGEGLLSPGSWSCWWASKQVEGAAPCWLAVPAGPQARDGLKMWVARSHEESRDGGEVGPAATLRAGHSSRNARVTDNAATEATLLSSLGFVQRVR